MSRTKGSLAPHHSTQFKEKLVLENINNGLTYRELSIKYNVSYFAVRKWCLDYEEFGFNSLISKTGKHSNNKSIRSNSVDPKDCEIVRLKKELKKAKAENYILKKFDELMKRELKKK